MSTDTQDPDYLMNEEELSTFIRVPRDSLKKWRHLGRGPKFLKMVGYVRYRRADVLAWLEASERTRASEGEAA